MIHKYEYKEKYRIIKTAVQTVKAKKYFLQAGTEGEQN